MQQPSMNQEESPHLIQVIYSSSSLSARSSWTDHDLNKGIDLVIQSFLLVILFGFQYWLPPLANSCLRLVIVASSGMHFHTFLFPSTLPAPYYVAHLLTLFRLPHLNVFFFLLGL